ncbi:hypothetical protein SK128_001276 [Halocaridina rubra]|uniref:Uncharacterized protein n=1 Tax=Halocaridina rubra TaxID=373956 RepID=A0AAN8X3F3_HALRR
MHVCTYDLVEMKLPCSVYKEGGKNRTYIVISAKGENGDSSPEKEMAECEGLNKRVSQEMKEPKIQYQVLMARVEGLERDNKCLTQQEEYLRKELREVYAEKREIEAKTREKVVMLQTFQKQQLEEKDEILHDYEKRLLNLKKDFGRVNDERFEIYNIRRQEKNDYEREMKCQGIVTDRLRIEISNLKHLQEMQMLAHQKQADDQKRREEALHLENEMLKQEKANLQEQLESTLRDKMLLANASEVKRLQLEEANEKLRARNDTLFNRHEEHIKEEDYYRRRNDELQHELTCCKERMRQLNMHDEKEKLRDIDCYERERDIANNNFRKMEESLPMHIGKLQEAKENTFCVIHPYVLREVMKNAIEEAAFTVIRKERSCDGIPQQPIMYEMEMSKAIDASSSSSTDKI